MNILIDIGHPAHVHLFKYAIRKWQGHQHQVFVYARDKDCTLALLAAEGIPVLGSTAAHDGLLAKGVEVVTRDIALFGHMRRERIDVAIGTSVSIGRIGRLLGIKTYVLNEDDVDVVPLFCWLAYPACTAVIAPRCVRLGRWQHKHVPYDGYQKLAYLHPSCFQPDPARLEEVEIDPDAPYFLLRLTAFSAHHDIGHQGLAAAQVDRLIDALSKRGRVLISSERPLSEKLEPYRLTAPVDVIHHVMAFATLFVGDSQSMCMESALLGVPSYRCNSFAGRCSVIEELQRDYGLVQSYTPERFDEMLDDLLTGLDSDANPWPEKRKAMLQDKCDVTAWLVDFIEQAMAGSTRTG